MNNRSIKEFDYLLENDEFSFLIGVDENDEFLKTNFKETLSISVAGKSANEIKDFIDTLIYQFEKKDIPFYLVDSKKQVIEEIKMLLENIINERFTTSQYEQKDLKPMVIIVDEWVSLLLESESLYKLFQEIICRGKAFGLYMILTTTNFDTRILKSILTQNICTYISFKVDTKEESKMILSQDMGGSENLLGTGDMLFLSLEIKKIQSFKK